jgi:hypothetical protein
MKPPKDPHYRTASAHISYMREMKEWRKQMSQMHQTRRASEVTRIIEDQQQAPVERILVDVKGHWIQATGVVNADRKQWAVYDGNNIHHGNFWGEETAKSAVYQLIKDGVISR